MPAALISPISDFIVQFENKPSRQIFSPFSPMKDAKPERNPSRDAVLILLYHIHPFAIAGSRPLVVQE